MATRRAYTAEFKREAVRLADERGNKSAVVRELGIHLSMLPRWNQELQDNSERAFPGKGIPRTKNWQNWRASVENSSASSRRTPF